MRSILSDHGWMRPDDGGYNRREGNTVLYFRDASARNHFVRRVELLTSGYYPAIIDAHRRNSVPAAKRLLTLMTGAWATQAIHVAAELKRFSVGRYCDQARVGLRQHQVVCYRQDVCAKISARIAPPAALSCAPEQVASEILGTRSVGLCG